MRVVAEHVTQVERPLLERDPTRGLEVVEGVQPDFVPTEDHFLRKVDSRRHLVSLGTNAKAEQDLLFPLESKGGQLADYSNS